MADKHIIENGFVSWLSGKVSPTQLSDYYTALISVNNICKNNNLLKQYLFLTTDLASLEYVKDAISNGNIGGGAYRNLKRVMTAALNNYIEYIKTEYVSTYTAIKSTLPTQKINANSKEKLRADKSDESSHTQDCLDDEVNSLLQDKLFDPLKEAMKTQGITTVQKLREVNLWPFLNRYTRYSFADRQRVQEKLKELLAEPAVIQEQKRYVLTCGDNKYEGNSPAECFFSFCEKIVNQFPLRFRSLIGATMQPGGRIAIYLRGDKENYLRAVLPTYYIPKELSAFAARENAQWLYQKCKGITTEIDIIDRFPGIPDRKLPDQLKEPGTVYAVQKQNETEKNVLTQNFPENDAISESGVTVLKPWEKTLLNTMEQKVFCADIDGLRITDLRDQMHMSIADIRHYAALSKKMFEIDGVLYHEEALIDWEEGEKLLDSIIEKLMQKNNGYVASIQLFEYARIEMAMFLNDNDFNNERAVFEMARHMYTKKHYANRVYAFNGKSHISREGEQITGNFDLACRFAEENGGIRAFEAMRPFLLEQFANASQPYSFSRAAKAALGEARQMIADCIHAHPEEILFTAGGTESDNWAIKSTMLSGEKSQVLITSEIEHHAVLRSAEWIQKRGFPVCFLPVDRFGVVLPEVLKDHMSERVRLVSIMYSNNEIGTVEPIGALADVAHREGAMMHSDAVQALGHIPVDVRDTGVDMLSCSAHKFNGPKGIGFLYVRQGVALQAFMNGGSQEAGYRAGTENVASIIGMAVALEENCRSMKENETHILTLENALINGLSECGLDFVRNGSDIRVPGNVSLSFKNSDGELLLHRLDLMGICVSTGSACDSKNTQVSHVLKAIHVPNEYARGTIRVSLGKDNTLEDVRTIVSGLQTILRRKIS